MTTSSPNAEQARYWTEDGGPNWVRDEAVYDAMLAPFNAAILDVLVPTRGEAILEVGCGFGSTALALAERGAVVHGVDISPAMIARARERHREAATGATFEVLDAQVDRLGGPYDGVTSRFGIMFFADPVVAFRNFRAASRPGGRLVFACWQAIERNPWMMAGPRVLRGLLDNLPVPPPAGAGPFAFGDPDFVRRVLTDAGWAIRAIDSFETPIRLGGDEGVEGAVAQALSNSQARALLAFDPSVRDRAADILRAEFTSQSVDGDVKFPAAVWLVSARQS